ncbi:MAG: hypothetical protein GX548_07660 [Lentisphaerae bacterium]|nr:hypothetical protein [Lentisphaerota bacterium]
MTRRRRMLYGVGLACFAAYLHSADFLFLGLLRAPGEAPRVSLPLPAPAGRLHSFVDQLTSVKLSWKDALQLRGWVFREGVQRPERNLFLVLQGQRTPPIFAVAENRIWRKDVSDFYHLNGDTHQHGFLLTFPTYGLSEPAYQIGFLLEDETGRHFQLSDHWLVREGPRWSLSRTPPPDP